MTMKNDTKVEEESTCQFKIDMRNLTNLYPSKKAFLLPLVWPETEYILKSISFCLTPSKIEVVTLLWKTLENFYFKILVYKQLQPKNEIK